MSGLSDFPNPIRSNAIQRLLLPALATIGIETTISIVIDKGDNRIMPCIHEDLLRRGLDKSGADIACRRANKLGIVDGSFSFDEQSSVIENAV